MPWSATMNVEAVEPDVDPGALLAGAQIRDARMLRQVTA
jgi:hypothetical protein